MTCNAVKKLINNCKGKIIEVGIECKFIILLKKFGFFVESSIDSISIVGNKKINPKKEIVVDSKFDHRIAMSFLCLGLIMENGVKVNNAETISTSFPNFYNIMKFLGAEFKKIKSI